MKINFINTGIMKQLGIAVVLIGIVSIAVPESVSAMQNRADQSLKPGEMSIHQLWIDGNIHHNLTADRTGENQVSITILTSISDLKRVNADSLAEWMKDGNIRIRGVQIHTESIAIKHSGEIRFLADFTETVRGSYLKSSFQVRGVEGVTDQSAELSIFPGKNHVISISFNTRIEGKDLISKNSVHPSLVKSYSSVNMRELNPVAFHNPKNEERVRGSFFYRNRFWVAGTAAVMAGSAAAAIIGSGTSPVYLPEPPGRPAFNR
ncbi:hypothetical protein DYD21_15690 [Rhodohalobacter sp. SW132]|uniref:hypothetical protein n=1 Tax=Rhodohalobacter sp. SW132 TaxID=2293433 RepID=UPI000E244100|nr:hypothetical protein [Rhodohalobacter sp. SW132]REL24964.1 hypothetical protein DYD21_15690 [Rhodohalobacter sp. SW132]